MLRSDLLQGTVWRGNALSSISDVNTRVRRIEDELVTYGAGDGRYLRKPSPGGVIPVFAAKAMFGARGDGATDDTTALQTALDQASLAGGIVALEPGVYVTDTLRAYPHASNNYGPYGRIVIAGANTAVNNGTVSDTVGSVLQHVDGSANPLIEIIGGTTAADHARAVEIRDLLLLGGDDTTWLMHLELITDLLVVERVSMYQGNNSAGGGIRALSCWNASFRNLDINGDADGTGSGHTGTGFYLSTLAASTGHSTVNQTVIDNVDIRKMGHGFFFGEPDPADANVIGPVTVIGGQCSNGDGHGCIIAGGVRGMTFVNHHVESNYRHGYLIGSRANNVKLLNAVHRGNGGDGSGYDVYIDSDATLSITRAAANIVIDGAYFQVCSRGIHVAVAADVYGIEMDHLHFAPASTGVGTAINISGAFNAASRIILGHELNFSTGFATDISDSNNVLLRKVYQGHVVSYTTDTTPSVAGLSAVQLNPGSATTYTNFDDGFQGQMLAVVFGGNFANVTIQHGTNIRLKAGANFTPADANDALLFIKYGVEWRQVHE